jgi:hypothetical protein
VNRQWWIAGAVLVVVIVAFALSQTLFKGTSEECRPVRALLDFNKSQAALIASKATDQSDAPIGSYQLWADGLAERAGKVNAPNLAPDALRLAQLAAQFVAKLPSVQSVTPPPTGKGPAPPAAYELAALNDQIAGEIQTLSKACPE